MRVEIITMWYNEAFLAPFFCKHYRYADKIHLFLDTDTTDNTVEIVKEFPNVKVYPFTFPDMLDDEYRFNHINAFIKTLDCDWVYVIDSDEFIFCKNFEDPKVFLSRLTGNLTYVYFYHVYRHVTEKDLDSNIEPVIFQRRHGGLKSPTSGWTKDAGNYWFNKPAVVKPETGIEYDANGVHTFKPNPKIKLNVENFIGAHWTLADKDLAIQRRIQHMRDRQSKRNVELGQDIYRDDTEKWIIDICDMMNNEPQIF